MTVKYILSVMIVLYVATGCKSEKSSKSEPIPAADSTRSTIDPSLVGSWATKCNIDQLGGSVYSETLFSAAGQVTHHSSLYTDTKCTQKSATISIKGTYTTGSSLTNPANAKELDLYYTNSIFTPHNSETVSQLNIEKACKRQWTINVGQDITEETCLGDTPENRKTKSLQIYRVTNSTLQIGAVNEEGSNSIRPNLLSNELLTKKSNL